MARLKYLVPSLCSHFIFRQSADPISSELANVSVWKSSTKLIDCKKSGPDVQKPPSFFSIHAIVLRVERNSALILRMPSGFYRCFLLDVPSWGNNMNSSCTSDSEFRETVRGSNAVHAVSNEEFSLAQIARQSGKAPGRIYWHNIL